MKIVKSLKPHRRRAAEPGGITQAVRHSSPNGWTTRLIANRENVSPNIKVSPTALSPSSHSLVLTQCSGRSEREFGRSNRRAISAKFAEPLDAGQILWLGSS